MNNLLLLELKELQNNYKDVLVNVKSKILDDDIFALLDEINVFWNRNRKLVECAIQYISKPYHTYVFTAATILDVDDNEHYPFLCLGDYHIWDDPIYSYIRLIGDSENEKLNSEVKKQIVNSINENIKIIDNLDNQIIILPLGMLSGINMDEVSLVVEKIFLGLFEKNLENLQQYYQTYKTIDDVISGLRENVKDMIVFNDTDKSTDELKAKFNKYKTEIVLHMVEESNDVEIFWLAVIGYLFQALDIILVCKAFKFVPYVRYNVSFKYILILASTYKDIVKPDEWLFKCITAHLLHNSFDKEFFSSFSIKEFTDIIRINEFDKKLFVSLEQNGITLDKPSVSDLVRIIKEQLEVCFKIK